MFSAMLSSIRAGAEIESRARSLGKKKRFDTLIGKSSLLFSKVFLKVEGF